MEHTLKLIKPIENEYDCDYIGNAQSLIHPINKEITSIFKDELYKMILNKINHFPDIFLYLSIKNEEEYVTNISINFDYVENLNSNKKVIFENEDIIQECLNELMAKKSLVMRENEEPAYYMYSDLKRLIPEIGEYFSSVREDFYNLHTLLVNQIIRFCKEHNLNVSDFYLSADGVEASIEYGKWTPFTDSSFGIYKTDYKTLEKTAVLWSM